MCIQCNYMKTKIISIGNSKGIRIPKPLLIESGLTDEVNLSVKKGEIRIKSVRYKRSKKNLAKASEKVFARDWLRPEEEKAWQAYQSDK